MLELNENEKIDSWDVVVRTTDCSEPHGQGRELSCVGDLGLDLPYTATKRIDQTLEEFYPCTWNESDD